MPHHKHFKRDILQENLQKKNWNGLQKHLDVFTFHVLDIRMEKKFKDYQFLIVLFLYSIIKLNRVKINQKA